MRLLVVQFGEEDRPNHGLLAAELQANGARTVEFVNVGSDSAAADARAALDAVLENLDGRRLVIDAELAGLNRVLGRLQRLGLLDAAQTAVLSPTAIGYLSRLGLPTDRGGQTRVAAAGTAQLLGVIKDDSGGVCVDSAQLSPWPEAAPVGSCGLPPIASPPKKWWVRAVVDDQRLCDEEIRCLTLRRVSPIELEATAQLSRFRRRCCRGRSLQLACDPAQIITDGVARDRPRSRRTFWSEPTLWRLALAQAGPRRGSTR